MAGSGETVTYRQLDDQSNRIQLSPVNAGLYPMSNGLTRLEARFYGEPERVGRALAHAGAFDPVEAVEHALVTVAPDSIVATFGANLATATAVGMDDSPYLAGIVLTGANESTNLSVFSVGKANAANQALFRSDVTYDGFADIAFIAITSTDGKFGGLRAANANCFAAKGVSAYSGKNVLRVPKLPPMSLHQARAFS